MRLSPLSSGVICSYQKVEYTKLKASFHFALVLWINVVRENPGEKSWLGLPEKHQGVCVVDGCWMAEGARVLLPHSHLGNGGLPAACDSEKYCKLCFAVNKNILSASAVICDRTGGWVNHAEMIPAGGGGITGGSRILDCTGFWIRSALCVRCFGTRQKTWCASEKLFWEAVFVSISATGRIWCVNKGFLAYLLEHGAFVQLAIHWKDDPQHRLVAVSRQLVSNFHSIYLVIGKFLNQCTGHLSVQNAPWGWFTFGEPQSLLAR